MARNKKAEGGPASGDEDWEADEKTKPERRVNADKIEGAAEERKRGGRTKKNVGGVAGSAGGNAGRSARKSGGRAGSDKSPFSSARAGTPAKGRSVG